MSSSSTSETVFIGWDVGGWNCDRNPESRDAIVILHSGLRVVGEPWRGNLRVSIAEASCASDWIRALFDLCAAARPGDTSEVTMAIDAPLGFSKEFVKLVTAREWTEPPGSSDKNPYLFRQTERHLFQRGRAPLSAIKDMIGSQATKGMHVLAKFAPFVQTCGVWTDRRGFRVIETYPTACRDSQQVKSLLAGREPLKDADRQDALVCAMVAHLFVAEREALESPDANVPSSEGWIWVPKDHRQSRHS